jgi:CheY-like chemotaxis protein
MDAQVRPMPIALVVEDDLPAVRSLATMLRAEGYAVETAQDGAAAVARLTRDPLPDVLITDLTMPHVNGTAVIEFARSRRKDLPVLVVTGYPEMAAGALARLAPPPTVLVKPIDLPELLKVVQIAAPTWKDG